MLIDICPGLAFAAAELLAPLVEAVRRYPQPLGDLRDREPPLGDLLGNSGRFKGMFDRWNKVPAFLVPVHIKPSAASRANGTLFDPLNDAIKAYVAGAPAAAMAICRSALEIVVKEHYLEGKSEPQWNLDHCINVAAARYRFLDQEKMHKHRRRANEVMHSYESASWFVDESDPVIPFIKDLRHWIEKAPDRHRA